jgi:GDPmannose 4,6-dehydratase
LYNHESEYRRRNVVTKKIVQGVVNIKLGIKEKIVLGNLNSRRDWSSAKDFVEAMWLILQQEKPDDYILSSNSTHSVQDLLKSAFESVGIKDWFKHIEIEKSFFRESETIDLIGDNCKIKSIGWEPKLSFEEMIKEMVNYELNNLQ